MIFIFQICFSITSYGVPLRNMEKTSAALTYVLLVCHDDYRDLEHDLIPSIIEGCPKLKTLTLQSSEDEEYLMISTDILEALQKGCKELKHLKLTKVRFEDIFSMEEIKKILPDCNLEFKDVKDDTYDADNSSDDYDSDNSLYVSFVF